jgi:hypothetical protein
VQAERLPVAFVPEQLHVTLVRDDVVDALRRRSSALVIAEGISTQRMLPQKHQTKAAPSGVVPTFGRLTAAHVMFSLPGTAMRLTWSPFGELGAARD